MAVYTTWYVVVVLEVAGKQKEVHGPGRKTEEDAKADLNTLRENMGSGDWINLDWISANPKHVVAAYVDSSSVGFA